MVVRLGLGLCLLLMDRKWFTIWQCLWALSEISENLLPTGKTYRQSVLQQGIGVLKDLLKETDIEHKYIKNNLYKPVFTIIATIYALSRHFTTLVEIIYRVTYCYIYYLYTLFECLMYIRLVAGKHSRPCNVIVRCTADRLHVLNNYNYIEATLKQLRMIFRAHRLYAGLYSKLDRKYIHVTNEHRWTENLVLIIREEPVHVRTNCNKQYTSNNDYENEGQKLIEKYNSKRSSKNLCIKQNLYIGENSRQVLNFYKNG